MRYWKNCQANIWRLLERHNDVSRFERLISITILAKLLSRRSRIERWDERYIYWIMYIRGSWFQKKRLPRAAASARQKSWNHLEKKGRKGETSIRSSLPGADFVLRVYIEIGPGQVSGWVTPGIVVQQDIRLLVPRNSLYSGRGWGPEDEVEIVMCLPDPKDPRLGSIHFWDSASKALGQGRRPGSTLPIVFED